MVTSERDQKRQARKASILVMFANDTTIYTNQVAKGIGVVWPVADTLLQELVQEQKLSGDKESGYRIYKKQKESFSDKVKKFFHL